MDIEIFVYIWVLGIVLGVIFAPVWWEETFLSEQPMSSTAAVLLFWPVALVLWVIKGILYSVYTYMTSWNR